MRKLVCMKKFVYRKDIYIPVKEHKDGFIYNKTFVYMKNSAHMENFVSAKILVRIQILVRTKIFASMKKYNVVFIKDSFYMKTSFLTSVFVKDMSFQRIHIEEKFVSMKNGHTATQYVTVYWKMDANQDNKSASAYLLGHSRSGRNRSRTAPVRRRDPRAGRRHLTAHFLLVSTGGSSSPRVRLLRRSRARPGRHLTRRTGDLTERRRRRREDGHLLQPFKFRLPVLLQLLDLLELARGRSGLFADRRWGGRAVALLQAILQGKTSWLCQAR